MNADTPAIELQNVTKVYRKYGSRQFATLKSALTRRSLLSELRPNETFTALSDFSIRIPVGCTFGLVGRNGSGKSTALKLVAGITKPTTGTVSVRGRISALIELGAGFHPEISGRENVFINGIMLGLSKKEIERRFDEIVEFAELADFIDEPVKTYSSGMYMRLGFSVAIHVNPEVLLVDEVLAVGDEGFTHKCLDKFADFKRRGKTVLLVTHSLNLVERFCDEAAWLDSGHKRAEGDPYRVIAEYVSDVERQEEKFLASSDDKARHDTAAATPAAQPAVELPADPTADMMKAGEGRWGSRVVEIVDVALLDAQGQAVHVIHSGDAATLRMTVRAHQPVDDFVFGVGIFGADGVCIYGTNTDIDEFTSRSFEGEASVSIAFDALDLVEGTYKLDVAVHKHDGVPYDYHRLLHTFRVKSRTRDVGIYRPDHKWTFDGPVKDRAEAVAGMFTIDEAAVFIEAERRLGRRIVFTNGVFDLLHPGHVRYLQAARAEGDVLVVGVNSDRSVRANKGPTRPVISERERAEVVAALACVDAVAIFDDETPAGIIERLQPDVLVKGADWAADAIVGRETVKARGGRVVRMPVEAGWSTSAIIEKTRAASKSNDSSGR